MNRTAPVSAPADLGSVLDRISAGAAQADAGERDLSSDIEELRTNGILDALCQPSDPVQNATLLRRIGRANLSVGRLVEGHMNAQILIRLYGTDRQKLHHGTSAVTFGVWGAEGTRPAHIVGREDGGVILSGEKRFASGLGLVDRAIVTVPTEDGAQLVIVPTGDAARADASEWDTSGMRATASGRFTLDGLRGELLGAPGDYETEPHFQGGVWRYAALHVGGLEALVDAVRTAVAANGGEVQLHRLARLATLAHSARLMVEAAASATAAPRAGEAAVALSLAAREHVEESCLRGMALADRALGTRSFAVGAPVERIRRDLGFFLRQADLDGKLTRVGRALCNATGPAGEIWGAR